MLKDNILELKNKGYSHKQIAKTLTCSVSTVSYHCKGLELVDIECEKVKELNLPPEQIHLILDLRKQQNTYAEIRTIVNVSIDKIGRLCKIFNLNVYNDFLRKSETIHDDINILYKELKSAKRVAKKLGVSRSTVLKHLDKESKINDTVVNKSKHVVDWRRRTKQKLILYKGGKCIKCSYDKCIWALEFHHRVPTEKDFSISAKSWSFERMKKEVDKCDLLCSNCHKEIHYNL